jgi:isoquinoline 1-oxidoreductase subunit beta
VISRSDFVRLSAALAGGMVLEFGANGCSNRSSAVSAPQAVFQPNQWLVVHPDETVTIIINKSEMGQGVATGLPTIVADELDVPFERTSVQFARAAPEYVDPLFKAQLTAGSRAIHAMWMPLRIAGATARAMLVSAAAQKWSVAPSTLRTSAGYVIDPASNRRASYGSLVADAAALRAPKNVPLKHPSQFTLIGKHNKRSDTLAKVTGSAKYGIDQRVPGMKFATVLHPPIFGSTIRSFDASKAKQVKGVTAVVQLPGTMGIAVVADNTWAAFQGRLALTATYDDGPLAHTSSDDLYARFRRLAATKAGAKVALVRGNVDAAHGTVVTGTFESPFVAHAAMEPMNATATVTADGVEIWAPTQGQTLTQAAAAKIAGVPLEKVKVHTTYLGGAFGRRCYADFTNEAVTLSKAINAPVQVIWPREEDLQHDYYKPLALNQIRGVLDANGDLVSVDHTVVMDSIMTDLLGPPPNGIDVISLTAVLDTPYAFRNYRVRYINPKTGVPAGFLREPGANANVFAVESFMDDAAHRAGKEPAAFRLGLLSGAPRGANVIRTVVGRVGKPAAGTAHGLAYANWDGTDCATIAEVSMSGQTVRVHRVWVVADCGTIVNPAIVEQQLAGATNYGLSMALMSKITLKNGAVAENNFYDFNVLRLKDAPLIDVHAIKSDATPNGIGEAATAPVVAAVGNAIFALTGKRVRRLPFSDGLALA